jgi:hypothetical protein
MKQFSPNVVRILLAILACWTCASAQALLVDWDAMAWTPGTLSNAYDIDPGTPGNDVTIAVGGKPGAFDPDSNTGIITPNIGTAITGGRTPVEKSFEIAADLYTISKVTLTVSFNPAYVLGVKDVSFSIFDIDTTTNNDEIKGIYGLALDGSKVAATITNVGTNVTLSGAGLAQVLTGNGSTPNSGAGSDLSNATISFGAPITSFVFTFANNAGAPRYQDIALSDIFFTPIPEINPGMPAAALCIAATLFSRRRTRQLSA